MKPLRTNVLFTLTALGALTWGGGLVADESASATEQNTATDASRTGHVHAGAPGAAGAPAAKACCAGMQHQAGKQDGMQQQHAMHGEMKYKMTGDADHDFAAMMHHHYEMGVKMAQRQLDAGDDPMLRSMAQRMVAEQKKQLTELAAWLENYHAQPPGGSQ